MHESQILSLLLGEIRRSERDDKVRAVYHYFDATLIQ
jgi:hypothetical protein